MESNIDLLKIMINKHFENLNKINELINKPKKSVNIIVVGGYNLTEQTKVKNDDIKTWNNPDQYPETLQDIEIPHYKDSFNLNEVSISDIPYYKNKTINIVVAFCSISGLDENWPTNDEPAPAKFDKVSNNDIRYIICGCSWHNGFPTETIINILGTPMQFSNKDDDILRKVFEIIDIDEYVKDSIIKDNFKKFINKEISWNYLNPLTRKTFCELVYGLENCEEKEFR